MSTSFENIIPYLIEYNNVIKEINALKNEIKNLRLRLKPRFDELEKSKIKYETEILKYLDTNNDPGIKYQDIVLFKDLKQKFLKKNDRNHQLKEICNKYQLSDSAVEEIENIYKRKKIRQNDQYVLKLKKK